MASSTRFLASLVLVCGLCAANVMAADPPKAAREVVKAPCYDGAYTGEFFFQLGL